MSEQILPAFNGQLDLRRAYGYNRAEVCGFYPLYLIVSK